MKISLKGIILFLILTGFILRIMSLAWTSPFHLIREYETPFIIQGFIIVLILLGSILLVRLLPREFFEKTRKKYSITRIFTVGEKTLAVIWVFTLVLSLFSPMIAGIYRFLIIVFLAMVGVPFMWYVLREEKSGDQGEIGIYPDTVTRIHPDDLDDYYRYQSVFTPDYDDYLMRLKEKHDKRKKQLSKEDDENEL